jgi:hypothetical protein
VLVKKNLIVVESPEIRVSVAKFLLSGFKQLIKAELTVFRQNDQEA